MTFHFIIFLFRSFWKVINSIINETKFVEMSHWDDNQFFDEYSKVVQMPPLNGDEMQRAKKIRPLATAGPQRPYRKLAGGVDLRRWSKRFASQSPSFSLSLSLPLPKGVRRVIYLNKPLDKKSTHDPPSASQCDVH